MTSQTLNVPPYKVPMVDPRGLLTGAWQQWFSQVFDRTGGTVDKVDAAHATATAAVPQETEVVAGGGLQAGGALDGNVAIALYVVKAPVASLPAGGLSDGDWAYALDGRKSGETAGNGSGVPVFWSTSGGTGAWYVATGVAVTA